MANTKWSCPECGQLQTKEHQSGEEVAVALCAACQEKADNKKVLRSRRD